MYNPLGGEIEPVVESADRYPCPVYIQGIAQNWVPWHLGLVEIGAGRGKHKHKNKEKRVKIRKTKESNGKRGKQGNARDTRGNSGKL